MVIIIIGVTGSGKTTVGRLLAHELGWAFYEGDDFHSVANIDKMVRGVPLSDEDRKPWLVAIRNLILTLVQRRESGVITCSALKKSYRAMLRISGEVFFVYLKADMPVIHERLNRRVGHFMNPKLLRNQFDTLEEPQQALQVNASLSPAEIVEFIRRQLSI
jgi:gluconokinase